MLDGNLNDLLLLMRFSGWTMQTYLLNDETCQLATHPV